MSENRKFQQTLNLYKSHPAISDPNTKRIIFRFIVDEVSKLGEKSTLQDVSCTKFQIKIFNKSQYLRVFVHHEGDAKDDHWTLDRFLFFMSKECEIWCQIAVIQSTCSADRNEIREEFFFTIRIGDIIHVMVKFF